MRAIYEIKYNRVKISANPNQILRFNYSKIFGSDFDFSISMDENGQSDQTWASTDHNNDIKLLAFEFGDNLKIIVDKDN